MVRMLFPPGPKGVGDRGEGEDEDDENEEEEEEECTRPFCEENERVLPVCCEGSLRDPLDREGMWEEGWEPERGRGEDRMEDFVAEEEEEGLMGLVASEFGADWGLPLGELG